MATSVAPEENWEFYLYPTDDGPVFVTFHTEIDAINRDDYKHCARAIIPIKNPDETGAATDAESAELYDLEDNLVTALDQAESACLLLARVTHAGQRELVFQVKDKASFHPVVTLWMDECKRNDITLSEHDGWDFFSEFIWPSDEDWVWIYDRRVVDSLIESGSDPAKDHQLEFCFCGSDADNLQTLANQLAEDGYTPVSFDEDSLTLVMARSMALNVNTIWETSMYLIDLATTHKVEYDGWGAEIVS